MRHLILGFIAAFFALMSACSLPRTSEPRATPSQPPRVLLLGLDGVGYSQFKKMQEGGYFRSFRPVAPMVASFPSISDPNWSRIMRAPLETSFTREHFDQTRNNGKGEIVGGLIDHVTNLPASEHYFDFHPEGAFQHLASMTWSESSGLYWLDSLQVKLFENQGKKVFSAFIVNTDFIAHKQGELAIFRYLSELDKKIEKLGKLYREKFGQDLEVILVSDHGNVFLKPHPVDIQKVLREDGWRLSTSLEQDNDVVVVVPEILSFAPFFTKKGREASLAKTVSRGEGVQVTLYMSSPTTVDFVSGGGQNHTRATIDSRNRSLSYRVISGHDPFNHIKYFKNGALNFVQYFQESLKDEYPNAIVRGWEGLTKQTLQSPSVLASPIQGYAFTNKTLELITTVMGLESVHGSFHREESLGVFVSTHQDLPAVVPDRVMDFVERN